jgi:hypothetical protein
MSTDLWSCFVCDPSALASLTAQFTAHSQVEYFPEDINKARDLLVEVENEFDMWDLKASDEAEETLSEIRAELQSTAEDGALMCVQLYDGIVLACC